MRRFLLAVSLFLLVVVTACSEDNSEYQAQRQEMVDALYQDMVDDDLDGFDLTDESRCVAEGVVNAFSDSRMVELGLDNTATAASFDDEVLESIELTPGEADEIVEVISSCVDWEAFVVAGFSTGLIEEGISENSAQCIIESISEESIDAFVDAMINGMSADIKGEAESSEDTSLAVLVSIGAEIEEAKPRCTRLGE